jgi:hypothetical protein
MSIDVSKARVVVPPDIYSAGTGTLADNLKGIDTEFDAANPATVAGIGAANTAFYGNINEFIWSSLANSFTITADGAPSAPSAITDWDGFSTDIAIVPEVSVNGIAFDGETGVYTVNVPDMDHVLEIFVTMDAEKTFGGTVAWRFTLRVDGVVGPSVRRDEFSALNDRRDVTFSFPWQRIVQDPITTIIVEAQPENGGSETLTIYKYRISFNPIRQL